MKADRAPGRVCERAADAGDTVAMVNLGLLLAEQDPAEARRRFERAADAGDTVAMVNLGLLLAEQDPAEARRRFERAADAGRTEAMICLSLLLAEQDPAEARRWYERAAGVGRTQAMINLGLLPADQAWRQHVAEMGEALHIYMRGPSDQLITPFPDEKLMQTGYREGCRGPTSYQDL